MTAPLGSPATSLFVEPARVAICDDSAITRGAIGRLLETEAGIVVVARYSNGQEAIAGIRSQRVDVLVLDVEMPLMDGLTALPELLRVDPGLRVIMASTLTARGANIALQALRLGAADYVPKPTAMQLGSDGSFRHELIAKVKGLARMRQRLGRPELPLNRDLRRLSSSEPLRLLAIGSSTGGPQALFTLIQGLGRELSVPVVITQHMPAPFTQLLADHITRLGGMPCAEVKDGDLLQSSCIFLAPGDRHFLVEESAGGLRARLSNGPLVNYCRPAVDPMLESAATACNGRVLTVMLTGMGHDGLAGTARVVSKGGIAIAQDEATSVVWGMPGAIAKAGLCHAVLPLSSIASKVHEILSGSRR